MSGRGAHPGISLWRDIHDPSHWVVPLFRRRYFHVYTRGGRKFYWTSTRLGGLNDRYPEFRRVLPKAAK